MLCTAKRKPETQANAPGGENISLHLIEEDAKLFHLGYAAHKPRSGTLLPRAGRVLRRRNMKLWCVMHPQHQWWVRILRRIFHPVIKRVEKITARHEDWQGRDPRIIRDL